MRNRVQESIPLAPLTTLGIGGPARYYVEILREEDVGEAVAFARARSVPVLVLGGGSNLLVSDDGFSGLVIRPRLEGLSWNGTGVRAGAAAEWDTVVAGAVERSLSGIECLSGIPGSVGGTPVQNVGAYGQEVADVISTVRVYDRKDDTLRALEAEDCVFGYRASVFNTSERGRYIVLEVRYELKPGGRPCLVYSDLARYFGDRSSPSLAEVREAVLGIRSGKAMLLVQGDPDCRSAGSFFRNPLLTNREFESLQDRARHRGADAPLPSFRSGDSIKVPAAWLVERAGFGKGTSDGPVGLSTKHALALVNRGGATAADVLRLAGAIQHAVEGRFGIRLRAEPVFVGFPDAVVSAFGAVAG